MQPELSQPELNRLSLAQLVEHGRQAIQLEDYERAARLLREAARRAPFRQDLKDLLATAVDGALRDKESARPPQSTPAARHPPPPEPPEPESPPPPPRPQAHPHPPQPPQPPRYHSAGHAPHPLGHATRRRPPLDFGRRHQRGPISAILLGVFVGLLLIAAGAGMFWVYLNYSNGDGSLNPAHLFSSARLNSVIERANIYRKKGNYPLAIEQLESLPPSPRRDAELAATHDDEGNLSFMQKPPNYAAAIMAYTRAVEYDGRNPKYGKHLGEAYYWRALEKKDERKEFEDSLAKALQSYQAVLGLGPPLEAAKEALGMISKIAVEQRNDVLLHETYKKIIDLDPDGKQAQAARRNLRSLGYKE